MMEKKVWRADTGDGAGRPELAGETAGATGRCGGSLMSTIVFPGVDSRGCTAAARPGTRRPPPASALLQREIELTDTRGSERAILYAALKWVNFETRLLWPSVPTWARAAGVSVRTAQRAINALVAKGILVVHTQVPGRVRKYVLLPRERLAASAAPDGGPVATEPAVAVPCRSDATGMSPRRPTPVTLTDEPSMHPPTEQPKEPSEPAEEIRLRGGWMDGPRTKPPSSLKEALHYAGIRGINLSILAGTSLKPEDVLREFRDVERDPRVRSRGAVLAARLAALANVELASRPEIDSATYESVARLEDIRRRKSSISGRMF
jgi:hypothetical protein